MYLFQLLLEKPKRKVIQGLEIQVELDIYPKMVILDPQKLLLKRKVELLQLLYIQV